MANQGDPDRIAGDLLNLLKGSISGPGAGMAGGRPQAAADDSAVLGMIKNVLKQNLPPGMAFPGQPAGTGAAQAAGTPRSPAAGAVTAYVDWVGMYRRQDEERRALFLRQSRERDETQKRHVQEMESFAGIARRAPEATVSRPAAVRPAATRPPRIQPLPSQRFGIVPGKNVGNWAVETGSGVKTFRAVSDEQAMREARRVGLAARSARLIDIHAYTPDELAQMRASFGVAGMRESMEAEFEQAIRMGLIPENASLERLSDREWGYRVGDDPAVRRGVDLIRRTGF